MFAISAGGKGIAMLNTVPAAPGPPLKVVPYNEFPSGNNPATGSAPSVLVPVEESRAVKAWSVWNCAPLVLTEKTVPPALVPPAEVVPYRFPPDNARAAHGDAPSKLVPASGSVAEKVCSTANPRPFVPTE